MAEEYTDPVILDKTGQAIVNELKELNNKTLDIAGMQELTAEAKGYVDQIKGDVDSAAQSAANAAGYLTSVKTNASDAANSAKAAKTSETNAKASETAAASSAAAAKQSETNAGNYATATREAKEEAVKAIDDETTAQKAVITSHANSAATTAGNTAVKAVTDQQAKSVQAVKDQQTASVKAVNDSSTAAANSAKAAAASATESASSATAAKGYRAILTMPETMSVERRNILKAYGAEIVLTEGAKGMKGAIEKAEQLANEIDGGFIPGQFVNPANPAVHKATTGPEVWNDTDGAVDIFIAGVGTGGTLTGTGEYLKEQKPEVKIVALEPDDDEIYRADAEKAFEAAKLLAKKEGRSVGISSGAALYAAIEYARQPENKGKTIVALLPDSGDRYYSTPLFTE